MSETEKARAKRLMNMFKMTIEQWEILFNYQKGLCWICKNPENGNKRLATDHEHKGAGEVRGLLCRRCNTLLGRLERPSRCGKPWTLQELERVLVYLTHPPARTAFGKPHYGYGRSVTTKTHRRLLKKQKRQGQE